jgi:alpha-L-fucosidase 2
LVTASFVPANPTYTAVTWSVSDASIATIDAQGNLTGVKKGTVTVTGTAKYDATVKGTLSITINATGINSIVADEIYVYPNPSDGSFTLEAKPASDVTILDVTGKVIYEAKTSADKTNLSISGKGIYLLQVKNNGIVTTKKLVVQ